LKEGPPAIVLTLSLRGLIMPIFNRSILAEYGRVLRRPRFGFASARTTLLLDTIEGIGLETQFIDTYADEILNFPGGPPA
jgi:hypothetical protein